MVLLIVVLFLFFFSFIGVFFELEEDKLLVYVNVEMVRFYVFRVKYFKVKMSD